MYRPNFFITVELYVKQPLYFPVTITVSIGGRQMKKNLLLKCKHLLLFDFANMSVTEEKKKFNDIFCATLNSPNYNLTISIRYDDT